MQRAITLALAVYSFVLIRTNLPHLPERIPMHFNRLGEPDRWDSPHSLWMMLAVQVAVSGLILAVPLLGRHFPGMVNLGWRRLSDYTPEQRERILPLLVDWLGYMSMLIGLLFVFLIRQIIQAALSPSPRIRIGWPVGLFIASTIVLVIHYLGRIKRVAAEPPLPTP